VRVAFLRAAPEYKRGDLDTPKVPAVPGALERMLKDEIFPRAKVDLSITLTPTTLTLTLTLTLTSTPTPTSTPTLTLTLTKVDLSMEVASRHRSDPEVRQIIRDNELT
tara:strand:+ start:76 stop:399 length:324 start_codon:yes stop_codon:yes gene_type:complete